jgi:hypothetical protein
MGVAARVPACGRDGRLSRACVGRTWGVLSMAPDEALGDA